MTASGESEIYWVPTAQPPRFDDEALVAACADFRAASVVVRGASGDLGVGIGGRIAAAPETGCYPLVSRLPALYPEWLGGRRFNEAHGVRFPYVAGAMANGIATVQLVEDMGNAGMLGFFGAAGLSLSRVREAIAALGRSLGPRGLWGTNLIHSPNEPELEDAVSRFYVEAGVPRISVSAYMRLTAPLLRLAYAGVRRDARGAIVRPRAIFAKISRPEVAKHMLSPAPARWLKRLVESGDLSAEEAQLAAELPVAEDVMIESDSGGHTDNRPLGSLFHAIADVRDRLRAEGTLRRTVRLGAAGGIGTPSALASAFALGADFVVTGSVNQGCTQSGLSEQGRRLLADADIADVTMAPAADMFELGVEVQVLRRGTLFATRAQTLHDLYQRHEGLEAIPDETREQLETRWFQTTLEEAWSGTRDYFAARRPAEVERAERDPKHRMALVFRSYLGRSSRWAIEGTPERASDFQIWCGPAMGAFNRWVAGSPLDPLASRDAVQVALNLLEGGAQVTRAHQLRAAGLPVPSSAFAFAPRRFTLA